MTTWDYCLMYWPQMTLVHCGSPSTSSSITVDRGKGDNQDLDAWHRTIGELGLQGWELTATLPYGDSGELYFRRPRDAQ